MSSLGRILIVDDEAPVREVLSEYFTTQGYAVETASSGPEAIETVRRGRLDLILLDVRMEGMDGVEVLRRIRGINGEVPVIMVTANEDLGLARETLKIGAFDYVAKPFDFTYLDRAVTAGLVHGGGPAPELKVSDDAGAPAAALALAVFRVTRGFSDAAHRSTGERLETVVLAVTQEIGGGRPVLAGERLADLALLLDIATDLGDLPAADRTLIDTALATARRSLPLAG